MFEIISDPTLSSQKTQQTKIIYLVALKFELFCHIGHYEQIKNGL